MANHTQTGSIELSSTNAVKLAAEAGWKSDLGSYYKKSEIDTTVNGITTRVSATESSISGHPDCWRIDRYSRPARVNTNNVVPVPDDFLEENFLDTRYRKESDMGTNLQIADYYIAKLTTYVHATEATTITDDFQHDDASAVYLNDENIAEAAGTTVISVTLNLRAGWNKIRFLLNEQTGSDYARFATRISTWSNVDQQVADFNEYEGTVQEQRLSSAETSIEQTANNVLIKATASDTTAAQGGKHLIESLINVAPDGVKIAAGKVEIDGTAVFKAANSIPDTRGTNENPQYYFTNYPKQSVTEFKQSSVMGLSGDTYCYVTTVTGWHDSTGGYPKQTAQIGNKTYWRVGTSNTAWGAWQETESTSGAQAKVDAIPSYRIVETSYSYSLNKWLEYAEEGAQDSWSYVTGVKVGDTVLIKGTNSDDGSAVYVLVTVDALFGGGGISKATSHGLVDPTVGQRVNNLQASGDNLIGRFNLNATGSATYDYITGKLTSTTTTNTENNKVFLNAYNNGSAVRQIGSSFGEDYSGKLCHWTFEKTSDFNQLRLKFNGNKADAYAIWDVASIPNGTSLVFSFMLDSISSDGQGNGGVMSEINLRVGNMPSRWSLAPEDATLVGGRNLAVSTDRYLSTLNGTLLGGKTISEAIPEGETITISVEVNADNIVWNSSGNKRIGCELSLAKTSGGYQYIGVWAGSAVSPSYNITDVIEGGSIHKRISKTFVTLGTIVAGTNINLYMQAVFSGTVSIGRIKLERGSHATDWSPAPEDQEAYVDTKVGGRNYILRSAGLNVSGLGSAAGSRAEYRALNVGQSFMSIAHGTQVTISFDLYMTVNTANPSLNVYNTNNKGPKSFSNTPTGSGSNSGITLHFTAAAGTVIDERVSVTGYINDRTSPSLTTNWLEFYSNYGTSNWFSISNLKMEIGSNATAWSPAPEDAVKRTQRIYYRKSVTGAPAAPSSWVVSSGDGSNAWTQKHISISRTDKYIYTCEQYEMADGTLGNTSILLDDTITVIDGGKILTGTVEANALKAKSLSLGYFTDDAANSIDNSKVQVGGRNYAKTNFVSFPVGKSETRQSGVTATIAGPSTITLNGDCGTQDWFFSGATVFGGLVLTPGKYQIWYTSPNVGVRVGVGTNGVTWFAGSGACSKGTPFVMTVTTEQAYFFTPYANVGASFSNQEARLMVEKGTNPTDWSPAPEDVDSSILSMQKDFNDQIDPINESIETLSNGITDQGKRLAATEDLLAQVKNMVDNLENTTSWLSFNEDNGLIIGDNPSDGSSFFYTQQKGSFMSFNQMTSTGSQQLMMLSGTNGVEAQKVTAEEVVTSRISSDWAISLEGDMFSIDYIGN